MKPLLNRDGNFSLPRKGGGVGMRQDFSPTSRDRAGMGLKFLDPPSPASPHPHQALLKIIIVNLSYPKTLLFKQIYQY